MSCSLNYRWVNTSATWSCQNCPARRNNSAVGL